MAYPLLAAVWSIGFMQTCVAQADSDYDLRFQATYVAQRKPGFDAAYSGSNSVRTAPERSYSATGTMYFGHRLWKGAEVYLNPEVAFGVPISNLTGLGGLTNGELARTSGREPAFYRARAFVRQTFGLGGGRERVDAEDNQLAGEVDRNRVVVTLGNVSALDVFDDNSYAKDPRTQFMNWALFAPGAWDYPADSRGYTWGLALEYITPIWSLRGGRFLLPRQSNGLALNPRIGRSYGDALELERRYGSEVNGGALRFLVFKNHARMGGFQQALDDAEGSGNAPDLATGRTQRNKYGAAINWEQRLGPSLGAFARGSWADGKSETFAFTEIDRSITAGLALTGARWGREKDVLGIAFVRNEISRERRAYLAAGGLGFFLGDGALRYAPERIAEIYYSASLAKGMAVSLDYQRIEHPGYNADRGPVDVFGVRVHLAF